jgi:Eukaryotic aspartyl protease
MRIILLMLLFCCVQNAIQDDDVAIRDEQELAKVGSYRYAATFGMGTPPQWFRFGVELETPKSSVQNKNSCTASAAVLHNGDPFNCFDPEKSSTFQFLESGGSDMTCRFASDVITLTRSSADNGGGARRTRGLDSFRMNKKASKWARSTVSSSSSELILCVSPFYADQFPSGVDAVLGLGMPYNYSVGSVSVFNAMREHGWPRYAALRFAPDSVGNRSLALGGYDAQHYGASLRWSESTAITRSWFHTFPLFDLRACGKSLLGGGQGQHWARVASAQPCLTLPMSMFAKLSKQLGQRCAVLSSVSVLSQLSGTTLSCALSYAESMDESVRLPPLRFRLAELGDELVIDLEALRIRDAISSNGAQVNRYYCIELQNDDAAAAPHTNNIVFGSLVLEQFYTVVDGERNRIGFSPLAGTVVSASSWAPFCDADPPCLGGQTYDARSGACQDPECSIYLLQTVDPLTKQCHVHRNVVIALIIVTALLVVEELLRFEIQGLIVRRINEMFAEEHELVLHDLRRRRE